MKIRLAVLALATAGLTGCETVATVVDWCTPGREQAIAPFATNAPAIGIQATKSPTPMYFELTYQGNAVVWEEYDPVWPE